MTIAIDVDGTIVHNDYPYMGETVPHAPEVLKQLVKKGHELIILTMREGHLLDDAEEWFRNHSIDFKYSNCNPDFETGSRKVYAHMYIDDHAAGCPVIHDLEIHRKPFVDWVEMEKILKQKGLI